MEVIKIQSNRNGAVLYSCEHADVREAASAAVKVGASLASADLNGAYLACANLNDADLNGADLNGAYLACANLNDADLNGAYLARAYLARAYLARASLACADLRGADLNDADLNGANLACANLARANLSGANLAGADLSGADLRGANLAYANLNGADLNGAYLACADLRGADLNGAKVGARGEEARLTGPRPIVQIGPIGSRNDWLLVFWCGDSGMRISTGCQQQISEEYFLERLAEAHGEGEQANIHAKHYIEALEFAKRMLKSSSQLG